MIEIKKVLYQVIDKNAKSLALDFSKGKAITKKILETIIELYSSAKIEREYTDEFFQTAYHSPITGELEFFISRILYHYSKKTGKNWKILLRKQEGKTAPDIRIVKDNLTICVIEIKAKAGWIQPVFSPERYNYDRQKFLNKHPYNPDDAIKKFKEQIGKYQKEFKLKSTDVFVFLPTLKLVHRKKYTTNLKGYQDYFEKTSGLKKINWLLLSENMSLDLSKPKEDALMPTNNFELFLRRLSEK